MRRKRFGDTPYSRRNAAEKANSLEYPTSRAILASGASVSRQTAQL